MMRITAGSLALAIGACLCPGVLAQRPVHSDSVAGGLRALDSDSEVTAYLWHAYSHASEARASEDSIQAAACGSSSSIARRSSIAGSASSGDRGAVIRAQLTATSGAPLESATLSVDGTSLSALSHDDGGATIKIPAELIPSTKRVVVLFRLIGYRARHDLFTISPGDTVDVRVSLCPLPIHLQQTVRTGPSLSDGTTTLAPRNQLDRADDVKQIGRFLIVLRRGRLFTVDLGNGSLRNRRLRSAGSISVVDTNDVARNGAHDLILVHDERIFVLGFDEAGHGPNLIVVHMNAQGRLRVGGRYRLTPFNRFAGWDNDARLVGDQLIFYASLPLELRQGERTWSPPTLRRAIPTDSGERQDVPTPWKVFRLASDGAVGSSVYLHEVTSCDLRRPALTCTSRIVVGPPLTSSFASPTALYMWTTRARVSSDSVGGIKSTSTLLRFASGEPGVSALLVSGSPTDEYSFVEAHGDSLNVFVHAAAREVASWRLGEPTALAAALLRISTHDFGDGTRAVVAGAYREVPAGGVGTLQNRIIGRWLLYANREDGYIRTQKPATLFAHSMASGETARLVFPQWIDLIDAMGSDALVAFGSDAGVRFDAIALGAHAASRAHFILQRPSWRSLHVLGTAFHRTGNDGGILGITANSALDESPQNEPSAVHFLRTTDRGFAKLGTVVASREISVTNAADECKRSCDDWFGNTRALFIDGRVFALIGYELIEAEIRHSRVVERQRLNFTPGMPVSNEQH